MTLKVEKDDHVRGSGPVTILVYGDYECPYTRAVELVIMQLRRRDSDSFRYVYRYFPLREIHPHAQMAAEAAESLARRPFLAGEDGTWVEQERRDLADILRRSGRFHLSRGEFADLLRTNQIPAPSLPKDLTDQQWISLWSAAHGRNGHGFARYQGPSRKT